MMIRRSHSSIPIQRDRRSFGTVTQSGSQFGFCQEDQGPSLQMPFADRAVDCSLRILDERSFSLSQRLLVAEVSSQRTHAALPAILSRKIDSAAFALALILMGLAEWTATVAWRGPARAETRRYLKTLTTLVRVQRSQPIRSQFSGPRSSLRCATLQQSVTRRLQHRQIHRSEFVRPLVEMPQVKNGE